MTQTTASTVAQPVLPLIERLAAAPSESLDEALAQLATGADLSLLMAIIRALVSLGVPEAARALLRPLTTTHPELGQLDQQLASLPSSVVARDVLDARLTKNLEAAVRAGTLSLDDCDSLGSLDEDVIVLETGDGHPVVLLDRGDRPRFLFPIGRRSDAHLTAFPEAGTTAALVGVPDRTMLAELLGHRTEHGSGIPIDILEPDGLILSTWLACHDVTEPLATEHLTIHPGRDCVDRFEAMMSSRIWRGTMVMIIRTPRPGASLPTLDHACLTRVHANQRRRQDEHLARQNAFYSEMTPGDWASRYADAGRTAPPLRVLGLTSRHSTYIQYAMRDLAAAFRRAGCEMSIEHEPTDADIGIDLWSILAERPYDMVITLNRLRFEFGGTIHPNLPFVGWIQDHMVPLWTRQAGESLTGTDLMVSHTPGQLTRLLDFPLDRQLATTNLTDPTTYDASPVARSSFDRFQCDVSYTGHGSETPEELLTQITKGTDAAFTRLATRFVEIVRDRMQSSTMIAPGQIYEMLLEAERDTGHPGFDPVVRLTQAFGQMMRLFDRLLRHETLTWVADWAADRGRRLRLHGHGWDTHPTLRQHAAGLVANGDDLRALMQASSINLQVTAHGSHHQRLLDCLACGGFPLIRRSILDVASRSFRTLHQMVLAHDVRTMTAFREMLDNDADVTTAVRQMEALHYNILRPASDATRTGRPILVHTSQHAEIADDDPVFVEALRTLDFLPHRSAGELPGYDTIAFASREECHAMLDQFVDSTDERGRVATPMREAVLRHDTNDTLVERILTAWRQTFATS